MSNGRYLSERLVKSGIHVSVTISVAFHTATCDNARDNVGGPAISQLATRIFSILCDGRPLCSRRECIGVLSSSLVFEKLYVVCMCMCVTVEAVSGTFRIQVTSRDIATAFVESCKSLEWK